MHDLYDVVRVDKERVPISAACQRGCMGVNDAGYLLAGELTQYRRDVAGIVPHQLLDGTLHLSRDVTRDHGHGVLGEE